MPRKTILRTITLLSAASFFFALHGAAQEAQEPSVAEAAKRTRTQQKTAGKSAAIITNDTLKPAPADDVPAKPESLPTPAPDASHAQTCPCENNAAATNPAPSSEAQAKKKKEIDDLKQQIADTQQQVDLQKRELALENDSYYSKVDFASDKAGKAKLDTMQDDLKQKQDDLAKLKAKLAELAPQEATKTTPANP